MERDGFDRAVRVAAHQALDNYERNWIRNSLLSDRGRYMASFLVLDLHFNACAGAGITAAQLRREVVEYNVCSPGRATAFLAGLRFGNFMQPMPAINAKEKRYGPTRLFLDIYHARWTNMFNAIREFDPDLAHRVLDGPAFMGKAALHTLANHLRCGFRPFEAMPTIRYYADREGGFAILLSLLVLKDGEALTARQVASLFCISRTHAANLLRKAVSDGLAVNVPAGFVAGPQLEDMLQRLFGMIFLAYEQAARAY